MEALGLDRAPLISGPVLYESAFHFKSSLNGLSSKRLCTVYHRVLKIAEYCVVNSICLENKGKPEI